jgi:hypothetical protein
MLSDHGKTLRKNDKNVLMEKNHHFNEGFCRVKSHIAQNMFGNCHKNIEKLFHFLIHLSRNAKTHCFSEAICSGWNRFGKIVRFHG